MYLACRTNDCVPRRPAVHSKLQPMSSAITVASDVTLGVDGANNLGRLRDALGLLAVLVALHQVNAVLCVGVADAFVCSLARTDRLKKANEPFWNLETLPATALLLPSLTSPIEPPSVSFGS